jgi:hypothetical protein
MKERETVTVGTPTKYEERTKAVLYPLSKEIADTLVGRGLDEKKVYQWFKDHEQETWDTLIGPMLDQLQQQIERK